MINFVYESCGRYLTELCQFFKIDEQTLATKMGLVFDLREAFAKPAYGSPHQGAKEVTRLYEIVSWLFAKNGHTNESILRCIDAPVLDFNGEKLSLLQYAGKHPQDPYWEAFADYANLTWGQFYVVKEPPASLLAERQPQPEVAEPTAIELAIEPIETESAVVPVSESETIEITEVAEEAPQPAPEPVVTEPPPPPADAQFEEAFQTIQPTEQETPAGTTPPEPPMEVKEDSSFLKKIFSKKKGKK